MRLWTLHPKYLDPQGLVALWREGLLARAVLKGETTGYRHHPQLHRFRSHPAPRSAINAYLAVVLAEAFRRGYSFNAKKIMPARTRIKLQATDGQLAYEWEHLMRKLRIRSPHLHKLWKAEQSPQPHPLFMIARGEVEDWERQR